MGQLTRPAAGKTYWAVGTRTPADSPYLTVHGSHYGVRVDVPAGEQWNYGRVFTSEGAALSELATLPKEYRTGGAIPWTVHAVAGNGDYWKIQNVEVSA